MTTRHVSAQNDYPFIPLLPPAAVAVVAGILDVYLVIQGPPTYETVIEEASSSSSEDGLPEKAHQIFLVAYTAGVSTTVFKFEARNLNQVWEIEFEVPNTGGDTGQVGNADSTDCTGILVFSSREIIDTGSEGVLIRVEPARAQWHTEEVTSITFANILRCAGAEDADVLLPELLLGGGSSSAEEVLDWNDGHNCAVDFADDVLTLTAGIGQGLGIAPDYGDTGSCSSTETVEDLLEDTVTVINGILPENGNIPLSTAASFGIQRTPGRIELIVKQ